MCKNIMEMHRFLIVNQPGETHSDKGSYLFSIVLFYIHFNQFSLRELSVTQK